MRYEIDRKHRIVDFYIEDEYCTELHTALSFDETKELLEEILDILKMIERLKCPQCGSQTRNRGYFWECEKCGYKDSYLKV